MSKKHHFFHYLILFLVLLAAGIFFRLFTGEPKTQLAVIASASLFYVLWGIIHHALEERVSVEVIGEYVLIGLVVVAGFWAMLR